MQWTGKDSIPARPHRLPVPRISFPAAHSQWQPSSCKRLPPSLLADLPSGRTEPLQHHPTPWTGKAPSLAVASLNTRRVDNSHTEALQHQLPPRAGKAPLLAEASLNTRRVGNGPAAGRPGPTSCPAAPELKRKRVEGMLSTNLRADRRHLRLRLDGTSIYPSPTAPRHPASGVSVLTSTSSRTESH
jgi:hypothetical protein